MKKFLYLAVAIALLAGGFIARAMNAGEAKRQAAVIVAADAAGTATATAEAQLVDFARLHTGAGTTYTLQGSYDRAVAAARAATAAAAAANSQIYADAQKACSGKTDSLTQARCNQAYLDKHLQTVSVQATTPPALASYRHTVTSPIWAPDLAGALLVGAVIAFMIALIQLRPRRKR